MSEEQNVTVNVDFYQYYVYGFDGEFDTSSVDMANDGILAPGQAGARINTGTHCGTVNVTIRVVDGAIELPAQEDAVASACNLELPIGVIAIEHWGGPEMFRHDFGRPLTCGLLVRVHGRDAADAHNYTPEPDPRERQQITISPVPFPFGRWRSSAFDKVGASLAQYSDHIDRS